MHSTFVADRFVVCTFVPRPIESDPGALKVPFFHSNDDFDEVIFYHAGEFFSRDNIKPGMMTFHPSGFTHGPHPKAFAAGAKAAKTMTDEVAVMIDARDPLDIGAAAEATEDQDLRRQLDAEMKLASLKDGRDGTLVVVSRDLKRCVAGAATSRRRCRRRSTTGHATRAAAVRRLRPAERRQGAMARSRSIPTTAPSPLPRAYQWADGSAYVTHVELVRKARGAEMPPSFWTDPLMYQGGSDSFIGPTRSDPCRATKPGASISRPRSRSSPTTCRWAPTPAHARAAHQAADAGQRRVAAQSDPGRARQEFRLLPVQAGQRLLAGRGDAGRTRRGLAGRQGCICRCMVWLNGSAVRRARMPAST